MIRFNHLPSTTRTITMSLIQVIVVLMLTAGLGAFTTVCSQTQQYNPGQLLAASPIAIPRPIRLEVYDPVNKIAGLPIPIPRPPINKDMGIPAPAAVPAETKMMKSTTLALPAKKPAIRAMKDDITGFEMVRMRNSTLVVRMHFSVDPDRSRPIYAGAWLFGPGRKDVGVGYKPVTIPRVDTGSVDIILTLPDEPFTTEFAEAMLIQSGQVIAKKRFAAAYAWNSDSAAQGNITTLKKVEQLQGAWKASILGNPVEYIFTPDGSDINNPGKFQWRCDAFQQTAKGTIQAGNQIHAAWTELGKQISGVASVELNSSGSAVKIIWNNGVVMTRNSN